MAWLQQHGIWLLVACWMALIFYLGGSRFGRAGSQALIDRWGRQPWLNDWLNRNHGRLRASFHYVEFITLGLLLYWALGLLPGPAWPWQALPAWLLTAGYAWFDEYRQSLTPGRMFRQIDFIHSLAGATIGVLVSLAIDLTT